MLFTRKTNTVSNSSRSPAIPAVPAVPAVPVIPAVPSSQFPVPAVPAVHTVNSSGDIPNRTRAMATSAAFSNQQNTILTTAQQPSHRAHGHRRLNGVTAMFGIVGSMGTGPEQHRNTNVQTNWKRRDLIKNIYVDGIRRA